MSTSPINAAKNSLGYIPANQRQRCMTCEHSRQTHTMLECRKGRFLVTAYAVCSQWQIIQPTLPKTTQGGAAC
jgi:hypothetical protein